jgi:hypothetical protein
VQAGKDVWGTYGWGPSSSSSTTTTTTTCIHTSLPLATPGVCACVCGGGRGATVLCSRAS